VSLLEINIKKEWFLTYEGDSEVVSFNSKILTTIMSLYKIETDISFETDEEFLFITFTQKDKIEKSFQINLIDLDSDAMESQSLDHSLEFSIEIKKLDQYFSEMQSFGDTLEIIHVDETIYMRSQGDEGKYMLKITHDLLEELVVEEDLKLACKVPLKYTSLITKLNTTFKYIKVHVSEGAPLTFEIMSIDEDKDELFIKFFIAPKVEDDDNFDYSEFESKNEISNEAELENYENEIVEP